MLTLEVQESSKARADERKRRETKKPDNTATNCDDDSDDAYNDDRMSLHVNDDN